MGGGGRRPQRLVRRRGRGGRCGGVVRSRRGGSRVGVELVRPGHSKRHRARQCRGRERGRAQPRTSTGRRLASGRRRVSGSLGTCSAGTAVPMAHERNQNTLVTAVVDVQDMVTIGIATPGWGSITATVPLHQIPAAHTPTPTRVKVQAQANTNSPVHVEAAGGRVATVARAGLVHAMLATVVVVAEVIV